MTLPASRPLAGAELPHRLRDLENPPEVLYVRGELPRTPAVAIVGTRHPTAPAADFARELAAQLGREGVAILSGGALGIDTAAHTGALETGVPTVVVAPAGFERPFPDENAALFRDIVERGGAYLSLVPDERPASRGAFFARNGCLVALAHVVVVVEAPFRSGARNAAAWARRLGRAFLVVPSAPWNPQGSGSLLELRAGAKLCTSFRDVLRELEAGSLNPLPYPETDGTGAPPVAADDAANLQTALPFPGPPSDPDAERRAVLSAIRAGALEIDAVCEAAALPAAVVQKHVLTLTLEGVLAPDPAGRLRPGSLASSVSVHKL